MNENHPLNFLKSQKSKPPNAAVETFTSAVVKIARRTVSAKNRPARNAKKPRQFAPNRAHQNDKYYCNINYLNAGWGDETRTPESVGNKIHLNWRHNFRGFGWNCAAETVRVRAAALRICSSRKDFGRRCPRGRWSRQLGAESHLVGWWDSNCGMRKEKNPVVPTAFCTRLRR